MRFGVVIFRLYFCWSADAMMLNLHQNSQRMSDWPKPSFSIPSDFPNCSSASMFSTPSPVQFTSDAPYNGAFAKVTSMTTDHIYVLCVRCQNVVLPRLWSSKVSMLNGLDSDRCLATETRGHNQQATWSHKLIVANAKEMKYRAITVVEEDYAISPTTWSSHEESVFTDFVQKQSWDIIRFGWFFTEADFCPNRCACQTVNEIMCTMQPGCSEMRSSVAYTLALSGFDRFLYAAGNVDVGLFAELRSTIVTPFMVHQLHSQTLSTEELKEATLSNDQLFLDNCVLR